jgi:hypothetical protein
MEIAELSLHSALGYVLNLADPVQGQNKTYAGTGSISNEDDK